MSSSNQPRVLVTGATGFIGRPTVDALQAQDVEVHAFVRGALNAPGVHAHRVDLLDAPAVSRAVADIRPSHLVHLAWDLSDYQGAHHLAWARASLHLLEQFQAQGGRRGVLAGSCFEYDFSYGYCTEHLTPTRPHTLYGQAKNSVSRLAHAFADTVGLSLATARIFFVYGPGQPSRQLIPHVIQSLLDGQIAECTHGEQVRDYLHVSDVAAACTALLQSEVEGVVNVGSGEATRLRDMIYTVADALDARSLVALGAREAQPGDPPLLLANPTRLHDEVGWAPTFTVEAGLRHTLEWWRQHHNTVPAGSG